MRKKSHIQSDVETGLELNEEEQKILDSVESGEWESVENFAEELAIAKRAAANSLRRDANINVRISNVDLAHIKQKAAYEGLSYRALISSLLHKYAAGHLN